MDADASYSASHVEELLKCPICLDRYKHPKHLPCQHTVCKAPCLSRLLAASSRMLQCPQCRANHPIPPGGVEAFPDNIIINNLLDLPRSSTRAPSFKCSSCPTTENLSVCVHCDKQLCSNCRPQHLNTIKTEVLRSVQELKRKLPRLSQKVNEYNQKKNGLKVCYQKLRHDIGKDIEDKVKLLNERRQALLTEVDVMEESRLYELEELREKYELETVRAASFCDSAESDLNNIASAKNMLDMKKQCLDLLRQVDEPTRESTSVAPTYHPETALNDSIMTYGRISTGGERNGGRTNPNPNPGRTNPPRSQSINGPVSTNGFLNYTIPTPRSRRSAPNSVWGVDPSLTLPSRHSPANLSSLFGPYPDNTIRTDSPPIPTLNHQNIAPRNPPQEAFSGFISLENPNFRRRRRTRNTDVSQSQPTRRRTHPVPQPRGVGSQSRAPPPGTIRRQGTFTRDEDDDDDDIVTTNTARRSISFQISLDDPPPLPPRTPNSLEAERPVNNYQQKRIHRVIDTRRGQAWFESCTGVTTAPDTDNIYIIDQQASKILIFDTNGRHIKSFGARGNGHCDLDKPFDAVFKGDMLYVTDSGNNRIQAYNGDGDHQRFTVNYNFQWPHGIASDENSLYVCDTGHGRVTIISNQVATFHHERLPKPTYIAVNRGRVVISDPDVHSIFVFSTDGSFLRQIGQEGSAVGDLLRPKGLAIDFQGFILVANSHNYRVDVYRENGRFYCTFGERGFDQGQFTSLAGICLTSNGRVVVCDGTRTQIF